MFKSFRALVAFFCIAIMCVFFANRFPEMLDEPSRDDEMPEV